MASSAPPPPPKQPPQPPQKRESRYLTTNERVGSFILWAILISIAVHLAVGAFFPDLKNQHEDTKVETVSETHPHHRAYADSAADADPDSAAHADPAAAADAAAQKTRDSTKTSQGQLGSPVE